jgi:hypothetical protein
LGRERRSGAGWAGWGVKKKRPVGLGLVGGKGERGKRKREWAEPKGESEGEKEMHLNALKFEFEI